MSELKLFENIALTFSGGGYRASSYALGVLSYLNKVKFKNEPLLKRVAGLSTVSGGTITGAYFAQCNGENKSFEEFYSSLYQFLNEDKLLDTALKKLESKETWQNSDKRQSLINSFALTYYELLTQETMGKISHHNSLASLQNICFNATDFSFGLAFRFQITGLFGNYRLNNKEIGKAYGKIRLADAIASSSCFPMGFEPILMPDDFFDHNDDDYKQLKKTDFYKEGIGLMDGGIVDNQGIGSTILANKIDGGVRYNLIMVCDVGSYKMKRWEPIMVVKQKIWIKTAFWLFKKAVWSLVDKIVPDFFKSKLKFFDDLKLNLLERMVKERITSAAKLVEDVFLKQLRRLNYNLLYNDKTWDNKRIANLIYELTEDEYKKEILKRSDDKPAEMREKEKVIENNNPQPNQKIFDSAEIASSMPTTLWFDQKDRDLKRLQNLVACGQFTTCYNLITYLLRLEKEGIAIGPEGEAIKNEMNEHWIKFKEDPLWMV